MSLSSFQKSVGLMLCLCVVVGCSSLDHSTSSAAGSATTSRGAASNTLRQEAMDAARLNRAGTLEKLLKQGVDANTANEKGETLLILAAQEQAIDSVKVLIAAKANLGARDKAGETALMKAIIRENDESMRDYSSGPVVKKDGMVEALLDAGAPVNTSSGWSPLTYAAYMGNDALVARLLKLGADVNAETTNGSTALMMAAANGHIEIVKRLLNTPASLTHQNDVGTTAESWARRNNHIAIADLLKSEIARGRK